MLQTKKCRSVTDYNFSGTSGSEGEEWEGDEKEDRKDKEFLEEPLGMDALDAVSYTHLDVYKRQSLN